MTTPHSWTLTAEELMASPRGCSLLFALVSHAPGEKDPHCKSEDEPWTDAERLHTEFMETASRVQHCIDRQRRLTTHTYIAD